MRSRQDAAPASSEIMAALEQLEKMKGISQQVLLEAIEAALVSAFKRNYGSAQNVRVHVDPATGRIQVFTRRVVAEEVRDPRVEVSLDEAAQLNPGASVGDTVETEVTPREFGRIAAQTAKQVMVQRLREAERGIIYEEFSSREGEIVTGVVQRREQRNVIIDLGRVEAVMTPAEQIPRETYEHGDRIKAYIVEVRRTTKGPQVLVSRTHPGLLKRLLELEVPEVFDGTVELKCIAREAGTRSKVAVWSRDPNVDAVGACVGPKGTRIRKIVAELGEEKIDVVQWDPDQGKFVANALSPARVLAVYANPTTKTARVVVPDHQLSLAIGKEGQNARLAAKVTGWKIDIKSESQAHELAALEAEQEAAESQQEEAQPQAEVLTGTEPEVPGAAAEPPVGDLGLDGMWAETGVVEATEAEEETEGGSRAQASASPVDRDLAGPATSAQEAAPEPPLAAEAAEASELGTEAVAETGTGVEAPDGVTSTQESSDAGAGEGPSRPAKGKKKKAKGRTVEEEPGEAAPRKRKVKVRRVDEDIDLDEDY